MRNQILAVATAVTLLFGAVEAGASGSSHHNNNDATGIGNVKQKGGININMQGSNDHNTINNSMTSIRNNNTNNITNKNNSNSNRNYNRNTNTNNNSNNSNNNNNNSSNNTNNNSTNNSATNNNNSSATATGGNATATGGNATANADANATGGEGGSSSSDVNVNVGGDEAAASSAAPTFLTSSNDTCMGSSGIGGQGMSFGFSVGTTWTDSNCIMLKNSRELKAQGHDKAAKARLCMDDDNAMAFELAGDPCPGALKSAQNAVAVVNEWKMEQVATSATHTSVTQTQTANLVPSSIESVETNE